MKVEIIIDESRTEPQVLILTDKVTAEVAELLKKLSAEQPQVIVGFHQDLAVLVEPEQIIRIFAADGKVFAVANGCEYQLRMRLYELEACLDKHTFVRISNSEIINLKKVKGFDLSFVGTICVALVDGTEAYVSRRYVSKIKRVLGI